MAEPYLYPEGSTFLNAVVPVEIKEAIREEARRKGISMSQALTAICREYFAKVPA